MIPPADLTARRRALWDSLLPDGAPSLWCPLLTPYDAQGRIDAERLRRHLDALRGQVGGLLVPGSTGDGWQLDGAQTRTLLDIVLPLARARGMAVLIGVLKPDAAAMHAALADTLAWLQRRHGSDDPVEALRRSGVAGFTLCAPHGAALTQDAIGGALDGLLATGAPIALYQLPQVTGNEIAPDTLRALAARHANLLMVKDTSGADRLAEAGVSDLFLVRGAEGGYSRHLKAGGGHYDGFLLSTANGLARPLAELIAQLHAGRPAEAATISARLEAAVAEIFGLAAPLPYGNPFTNANKAIDHFMAHGPAAGGVAPPRLHSGERLPAELLERTGEILARHGLLPARGYLQD
ncbi:MAG: dihydrodipicolinate synthase family protein [Piscinibacter sp.]|nr:dihydrodipicolinate synthase family protein [Piscinibacter sp.]